MPTAAFYTLGCKVNQYESFSLMQAFGGAGFTIVEPGGEADVYIVNSCTVTGAGDKKSLQALRRFRRQAPGAVVVLCGCLPQAFPQKAGAALEADIVMGSKNRGALLVAVLKKLSGKGGRVVEIADYDEAEPFEKLDGPAFSDRARAYLKIQDGCDRNCAYCIVPAARGPARSKPLDDIRAELENITSAGYKEAVLTGVNLCRYGHDLGILLTDAIAAACKAQGLARIRLGSLEPDLITNEDIERWAAFREATLHGAVLCPHFHLSLQSGCDETLRRMNRRYDTQHYRETVRKLREAFPGCAVTTDIIAGFPGETEDDHQASLNFAAEMYFARVHVFAFSPRPGTSAAGMPDKTAPETSARRAKEISQITAKSRCEFLMSRIGNIYPVLFESMAEDGVYYGHTPCYTPVWARAGRDLRGEMLTARITATHEDGCWGSFRDF